MNGSFIRLLDILPGRNESVLECNLQVASLRSKLSYKAVSYAWIDETVSSPRQEGESIICGQKLVVIPGNLHSALQAFRSTTSVLTLWVDFLCINQQDTQERNQQVGKMNSLYSGSLEVLVWLGANVAGDFIGTPGVPNSGMDDKYKVIWRNNSLEEFMISSYIERFNKYEYHREHALPISCSRDIFGAFLVLYRLAQGDILEGSSILQGQPHQRGTD